MAMYDDPRPVPSAPARTHEETLREAARMGLSRLTLARASMRAFLKSGDRDQIEAWLLACEQNRWLEEIQEAMLRAAAVSGG